MVIIVEIILTMVVASIGFMPFKIIGARIVNIKVIVISIDKKLYTPFFLPMIRRSVKNNPLKKYKVLVLSISAI